jgi:hypothetical protein
MERRNMTPKQFVDSTLGKQIDTDNYPRENPYQCWDYFDYFCRMIGFQGSRKCASTGFVGDLWLLRDADGYKYSTAFDYVTNPSEFKSGDWVFWDKHVALFMSPNTEVGQNQNGKTYVTEKEMNWNGVLGAMRWRGWQCITIPYGSRVFTINGHEYMIDRMGANEGVAVLSAGINKVAPIRGECFSGGEYLVTSRIGGANYYQAKQSEADPYGTTYGDQSSPYSGTYQCVDKQDNVLFYDLEDGTFGDCIGVQINSSHNVFSPALVFPNSKGHWEYAKMVGLSHKDVKSYYNFIIRFPDGYSTGAALQQMTPQEIVNDFITTDMINIAFLDGGGSAQYSFWLNGQMEYEDRDKRPLPSMIVRYQKFPVVAPSDEEKDEETPMEPVVVPDTTGEAEELQPIQDWKDPEEVKEEPGIIVQRIAALLSVKSLITIFLTVIFGLLVLKGEELPDKFVSIYTMCISFFFGYQFKKAEAKE